MPKTNINCSVIDGFRVEVGWSPDMYVQVATVNTESPLELQDDAGGPASEFLGWYATLDREGCNRLIRAVRQARDAAYGRDD
jgi:hypothetical protein